MVLARGDAFTQLQEEIMDTKTIKVGDREFSVPVAVADALATVEAETAVIVDADGAEHTVPKEVADQFKPFTKAKGKGKGPDDDEEEDKPKDSTSELRAKVDTMQAKATVDESTFAARVDARVSLVAAANSVLGRDFRTDGVDDADIMRAVVLKVLPAMESKLDANTGDRGYLRASYDQAMDLHDRRATADADTNTVIFDALKSDSSDLLLDAVTTYAQRAEG
jgi:hypothetical protein